MRTQETFPLDSPLTTPVKESCVSEHPRQLHERDLLARWRKPCTSKNTVAHSGGVPCRSSRSGRRLLCLSALCLLGRAQTALGLTINVKGIWNCVCALFRRSMKYASTRLIPVHFLTRLLIWAHGTGEMLENQVWKLKVLPQLLKAVSKHGGTTLKSTSVFRFSEMTQMRQVSRVSSEPIYLCFLADIDVIDFCTF